MNKVVKIIFIYLILSSFGCKKQIENPETLDPIYKDLVKEAKEFNKLLAEEEKNYEGLLDEKDSLEPHTIELKANRRNIKKVKRKILVYKQKAKYYEIRAERRRVEGRRAYKIAFDKGEDWPDPQEFEHYQTFKKLKLAPKNWDARVPKLHKENPNFTDVKKE